MTNLEVIGIIALMVIIIGGGAILYLALAGTAIIYSLGANESPRRPRYFRHPGRGYDCCLCVCVRIFP